VPLRLLFFLPVTQGTCFERRQVLARSAAHHIGIAWICLHKVLVGRLAGKEKPVALLYTGGQLLLELAGLVDCSMFTARQLSAAWGSAVKDTRERTCSPTSGPWRISARWESWGHREKHLQAVSRISSNLGGVVRLMRIALRAWPVWCRGLTSARSGLLSAEAAGVAGVSGRFDPPHFPRKIRPSIYLTKKQSLSREQSAVWWRARGSASISRCRGRGAALAARAAMGQAPGETPSGKAAAHPQPRTAPVGGDQRPYPT